MKKKKISLLQMILTLLFVVSLLISNIITSKQMLLPFGIVMTGAVVIFPITYILSDIFSEVYGYKWSRLTCYLAFIFNLFMVIIFTIVIKSPAPDYWLNQDAFEIVLGSTPRILFASLTAFMLGDFVNDKVFKKMKDKHLNSHNGFNLRAMLSSLCGEFTDSLIFIPLAFIGTMPFKTMIVMGITQVLIKTSYELLILPVTNILMKKVSNYENKN